MPTGVSEEDSIAEIAATELSGDASKNAGKDAARQQAALAGLESFRIRVTHLLVTKEATRFASDDTLLRYLRARDANEEKALALFQASLTWRAKNIDPLADGDRQGDCPQCQGDPRSHCFFHVGSDVFGRPVVYSCAGRATNKVVDDNMIHMALELERLFDGNRCPGKYVWVIDFKGMGVRDANPRMATTAIPMFADHYPERMGQIVLLNPPAMFQMFWTAVKPILDPVTKEKIVMLRGQKAISAYAAKHWQQKDMAAWLDAVIGHCNGAPGCYPDATLSDALADEHTRAMLAHCRQLK